MRARRARYDAAGTRIDGRPWWGCTVLGHVWGILIPTRDGQGGAYLANHCRRRRCSAWRRTLTP